LDQVSAATAAAEAMRIDQVLSGVSTPAGLTAPGRASAVAQGWLVGQLLTIGVIGRLDENSIRLTVDGRDVIARTTLDLKPGTTLTARVSVAGPQPQLSIVTPHADSAALARPVIAGSLSVALPAQEPISVVLNRLSPSAQSATAVLETGADVQTRLTALTTRLPDLPTLGRPSELTRAVLQAGPLLEATLATQVDAPRAEAPTQDLKWQLLGLRQAIDDQLQARTQQGAALARPIGAAAERQVAGLPPLAEALAPAPASLRTLAGDVDAGIARITTHQLQHLAAAEAGNLFAYTEIPFRTRQGIDTVAIEIEADEGARGGVQGDAGSVALNLAVPLEDLGELRARIGLSGDRLAVTLWSETPALRALIGEDIAELEQRLMAAGFEVSPIAVRHVDAPDPLRHLPRHLIDTAV